MNDKKIIKNLSGHSGCKVYLTANNGNIYVSKISASKEYNFRLKKQCQKQRKFFKSSNVSTPNILNYGYDNELFYFDMEYVKAKTMAEYINEISIIEISDYIKCLFASLYFKNEVKTDKSSIIFLNKIQNLKKSLYDFTQLKRAFEILENFDWNKVPKTPCHGDLTLENILVTQDKRLYLIDFLDSFYNSWIIDIAKLLQDLELKWSFRHKTINSNMELRLLIAKEALIEEILKTENGKEKLDTIYHVLLLHVIRIYPYAKDEMTFKFLNNALILILNKIDTKKGAYA